MIKDSLRFSASGDGAIAPYFCEILLSPRSPFWFTSRLRRETLMQRWFTSSLVPSSFDTGKPSQKYCFLQKCPVRFSIRLKHIAVYQLRKLRIFTRLASSKLKHAAIHLKKPKDETS
ncbi:hypothetical protein LC653_36765 [Nostoc sp. CHAB 5784]|uniref:hypothetical protein n=1 Tax=Nostoc mirabile TaxID=2907820 RepID=UPI001E28F2BB|nr:hypothetical protein [Nostoc mirabile]MCC5669247.1 hypothetical protein [Nostoc mirabile CHAB5784]